MPNSLHSSDIDSPAIRRLTNCILSSITDHSFHGIHFLPLQKKEKSVTHVSGTNCHPCLRSVNLVFRRLNHLQVGGCSARKISSPMPARWNDWAPRRPS